MPKKNATYVVANPRGIPKGKYILQNKDRTKRWFEGDVYDGEVAAWLVDRGFLVEVKD